MVTTVQRSRKRIAVSVDSEVAALLSDKAADLGMSFSRMAETALIAYSEALGLLPEDYEPIGETRGGDRTNRREAKSA